MPKLKLIERKCGILGVIDGAMGLKKYKLRHMNRPTASQPISPTRSGQDHWAIPIDEQFIGPNPWTASPVAQLCLHSI